MIKLFSNNKEVHFSTTIFPDGTSQVWKVDGNSVHENGNNYILWLFENEAELFHICQLARLLQDEFDTFPDLVAPYLPYGRQDKQVGNEASFALQIFTSILDSFSILRIESFDPHSKSQNVYPLQAVTPSEFHRSCLNNGEHDFICYPDKGAAKRYAKHIGRQFVYAEKIRDQLTGEITGMNLLTDGQNIKNKKILIVDDICDGGMTFIKVAELLKTNGVGQIDLAVSHGLFSKGKQVLHDAGISKIYTTNSLLRNPEGFKVW
jgi:ribose-phosphate pyrophosphokinase